MDITKIKPIPKYIEKKIRSLDKKNCTEQKGLRFYAYLTKIDKELVKITVALRNKTKKVVLLKQVAVHGVSSQDCYVKDLEYCYLGVYAYKVGWYDEGIKYKYNIRPYYNDGKWYSAPCKYYNVGAMVVNLEYVAKFKEFQYSAIEIFKPICPIRYLRLYKEFPQLEMMAKFGFNTLATSRMILRKVGKDKKFAKWLILNKDKLGGINSYKVVPVIKAYNNQTDVDYEQILMETERLRRAGYLDSFLKNFGEYSELISYLTKKRTNYFSYKDYYTACESLGLDMTLEKNKFPHDFQRWHRIRTDQFSRKKKLEDEEKRKEMFLNFANIAEKYAQLERTGKGSFVVIIAKSPEELEIEGKQLDHCVGGMNYCEKFIREESLIFFIRRKNDIQTPFVTMEYSINKKQILQCYGKSDTKPSVDVLDFVNKKWLPFANQQMQYVA